MVTPNTQKKDFLIPEPARRQVVRMAHQ